MRKYQVKHALILVSLLFVIFCIPAYAAHPLVTDDTGTQGKGRFQMEINAEFGNDSGNTETSLAATLSAGLLDNLDIAMSAPYILLGDKDETGSRVTEQGISDLSFTAKWRLYEHQGLSIALKPGITVPTGDNDRDLGDGKPAYSLFLLTTKEIEPFIVHLNLGYILNRLSLRNIYHCSVAAEYAAAKDLRIVGNAGGETNPDRSSDTHPFFVLGGLIYRISESFDIDFGVKAGLNRAEDDYELLAGLTFRF